MKSNLKKYMEKSSEYEYLSQEKEKELGEKILKGDMKAREDLINSHLRMVVTIAKRFCRSNPMVLEDLIQEGNLGLITAADHFDPNKNIRFSAYAKMWIVELIKRKFYKDLYIVKTPFRVAKKSIRIQNEEDRIEKEKKRGEDKAIENMIKKPIYLSYAFFNGDSEAGKEIDYFDILTDEREIPSESIEKKEMIQYLIQQVEKSLDKNEAAIIRKRFLEPEFKITYKKLSDTLNISSETVRNLEKKALKKLKKNLSKDLCLS